MREKVLITAIGSASADAVIRNLSKVYDIIGTNIYPKEFVATSVMVDVFYEVPIAKNTEKYVNEILEICKKEGCQYVIPLTDPEVDVLSQHRTVFAHEGIVICISDEAVISICRNKRKCSQLLLEKNICNCIPEIDVEKEKYEFPLVAKIINGRSSEGLEIFRDKMGFHQFVREKYSPDKYLVQPFIEGTIVTVDILRKEEECIVTMREEIIRTENGLGLTVRVFDDPVIKDVCVKIANALNIKGCVCFEFIRDNENRLWFLECNPRFSGGISFSVIAGYNYPINHMKCFQNKKIDRQDSIKKIYISRKYEEVITGEGKE